MRTKTMLEGYGFLTPWIIGFLIFMVAPLGRSLYYAFQDLRVTSGQLDATFIGLRHFRFAFTVDVDFLPIVRNTVVEMALQVPLILIFAMFSALLLNRSFRGRVFFRGVFFLPVIIAAGSTLQNLLDQGAAAAPIFTSWDIVSLLDGYVSPDLLAPLLAFLDSSMLVMWKAGVPIIILIAGLQTISTSLYEAARCDGATPWESFWKITFPMIQPMLLVSTLFCIVDSFTSVNNEMMQYIYTRIFVTINYGYASAIGWIYFILIFLVIGFVLLLFRNTSAMRHERR